MSGVKFEDAEVYENGSVHSIVISGELPEGVTAYYENNGKIYPGSYVVTVRFSGDSLNYYPIDNMTATLTILPKQSTDVEIPEDPGFPDIDDPVIPPKDPELKNEFVFGEDSLIKVETENSISEEYELNAIGKTESYKDFDFSGTFGENKNVTLIIAYDIHFLKDGKLADLVDNNYIVRILVPEDFRGEGKVLGVVHIKDDGTVEPIDSELVTREGDYIVFPTVHFSVYAIVEITDVPSEPIVPPVIEPPVDDPNKTPWITYALIIILVLLVCSYIALL